MKTIALIALLPLCTLAVQDMEMPEPSPRLEQHRWLEQLVGEWDVDCEMSMGQGMAPMMMESTESVRALGGLWIVAEGNASFGGTPFTSMMTIGYDPDEQAFVGTWIDTRHSHLWNYTGSLDAAKKVLTLETEGPRFDDPSKTASYRDAIEIKGPGHKVMTSSIQNADGTWTTFVTANHRRKTKGA